MPDLADTPELLHISTHRQWTAAQEAGAYRDPSLESEGFIHLSTPAQVLVPANERYWGRTDLVLLVISADRLTSPLVFEDSYGSGMLFPHVYGPIDLDAVTAIVDFPPAADGTFVLPALG